jgi:hypothetical protein
VRGKRVTAWTLCATTGFFNDLLGRAQDLDLHRLPTEGAPEFINRPLYYYCLYEGIAFTRSRPYRKNDSAHVEQKNGAIVRALVGYDRYASRGALRSWRASIVSCAYIPTSFNPCSGCSRSPGTGTTMTPPNFSSYTRPSRWNGSRTSVGCIGTT